MNKSVLTAGIIVIVLAVWMLSGIVPGRSQADAPANNTSSSEQASTSSPGESDSKDQRLMKVEVQQVEVTQTTRDITLQGQLEPIRRLQVVAQKSGIVEQLPTRRGQRVEQDDLLVRLSLESLEADLKEAKAQVVAASGEQRAAQKLQKSGLQSQSALSQANAQLASAIAVRDRVALQIVQTQITAPFAGVLNDVPVEMGMLIERGTVIADLVDDSGFKIMATAAQQMVSQIKVDQAVTAVLITGEELQGKITYISSVADADTRSFVIEAEVGNDNKSLAAGVSASLIVPLESIGATLVSPSALALGSDGEIGVKSVDGDDRVVFHSVEIISTNSDGAWVTGIPDKTRVITLGQGFVNAGDLVEPVELPPG